MKYIKPFRTVRASIINEKLKAKKPGEEITIDVDLDYEPGNKYAEKAFKKFKLKVEPNGATEVSHDMTGTKQNIINYLQSPYYEFDDEDIRDIYPELLEASVKKGDYVLYKGNGSQWTKSKVMQVIPSKKKLHIDWNDEYIEVDIKNVKPVKESVNEGRSINSYGFWRSKQSPNELERVKQAIASMHNEDYWEFGDWVLGEFIGLNPPHNDGDIMDKPEYLDDWLTGQISNKPAWKLIVQQLRKQKAL